MSFLREWLPITRRNRVALLLSFSGLVMFVMWNCLPCYTYPDDTEPNGIMASFIWPRILSADSYIRAFKSPHIEEFLGIAAQMALIQSAVVTFAVVPFWKLLHGSVFVRLPLAFVNMIGGAIMVWFIIRYGSYDEIPYRFAFRLLVSLNMLALSAALFTFKNELALREEKNRPIVP